MNINPNLTLKSADKTKPVQFYRTVFEQHKVLCNFDHSFIENLLTFSFICWFSGLSVKEKNSLNTVVKVRSKISGIQRRNLGTIWEKQAAEKAKIIISQPDHIMLTEFLLLPSGRRYNVPKSKSNRYAKSFIPSAIKLLNTDPTHFRRI